MGIQKKNLKIGKKKKDKKKKVITEDKTAHKIQI